MILQIGIGDLRSAQYPLTCFFCKTILVICSTCVRKSFSIHPVLVAVGVGAGGERTCLHLGFALFGLFLFYLNFLFGLFSLPSWTLYHMDFWSFNFDSCNFALLMWHPSSLMTKYHLRWGEKCRVQCFREIFAENVWMCAEASIGLKCEKSLHPKDLQAELEGGAVHRDHHHRHQHHPHQHHHHHHHFLKDLKAGVKEKRGGKKKGKWKARSSKSNCNRARYLKIFEVIWKCEL